jgi:hypothetical protein
MRPFCCLLLHVQGESEGPGGSSAAPDSELFKTPLPVSKSAARSDHGQQVYNGTHLLKKPEIDSRVSTKAMGIMPLPYLSLAHYVSTLR